ncbi:MAG TPA: dNTP triphosphohydrolase, partial [Thermoanaerobaculia bacterium]|nr:dNTP triphosphohydrolase [Thermoanaerobaculia bacterium]
VPAVTAETIIKRYDNALDLWASFGGGIGRRLPEEIREAKDAARDERWASDPSDREHPSASDGYRLDFQRDRDRVLWSGSLRKLSAKTQLFPFDEGDQLRQRLAHSLEVMQLASTIADSFGLDRDLVEAGALAHDIGHTPFGHAGEFALDRLLVRLDSNAPGFNHYEHGVDVVRYLEGPYQHHGPRGYVGLNLTPEVLECIFKHTYCQSGDPLSHDEIRKKSKHASYLASGYSHLEGQAVRIADKISYLISDVEDGFRLGAIDDDALLSCRLFHRPPIDLTQPRGESLLKRFLLQRRNVLRVLMEDVITEAARRLARITSPRQARLQSDYLIDHSSTLKADVSEVWDRLQKARLHQDSRVIAANMKAAKTISELLLLLSAFPALIEKTFAAEHGRLWGGPYMKFYLNRMGESVRLPSELLTFLPLDQFIGGEGKLGRGGVDIRTENLVLAKDFAASLTDDQARKLHSSLLGSSLSVR